VLPGGVLSGDNHEMSRGLIAVLALFFVGGAAMMGGAVWSYLDEHSGTKVKADVGKTLDVRLHGGHASRPQLWISIALAVFGLVTFGMGFFLLGALKKARARASADPSPEPAATS
jgi:hypothetical protein